MILTVRIGINRSSQLRFRSAILTATLHHAFCKAGEELGHVGYCSLNSFNTFLCTYRQFSITGLGRLSGFRSVRLGLHQHEPLQLAKRDSVLPVLGNNLGSVP